MNKVKKIIAVVCLSLSVGGVFASTSECGGIVVSDWKLYSKNSNKCVFYSLEKSNTDKYKRDIILATVTNGKMIEMQGATTICGSRQIAIGENVYMADDVKDTDKVHSNLKFFEDRTAITWKQKYYNSDTPEEKLYYFMCNTKI